MPKSKVRKKTDYTINPANRTPVKIKAGPSSTLYISVMLGLMLLGLLWIIVFYLAGENLAWMNSLGSYNFAIGFGFMIVGLIMTMRWR
ncbi:cell division protein CrgA [Rhodococcus xishaensis]|uniref:Cell division protein CrgA n=1 Tax=Rhodococcus xishaensis TaxID=2487364 RepID=A0A438ATQ0_9NOCA|nr:cell division protein CrgA [Rhodococcus xishaensis]RVW02076.1 cell division protein CrgA [Rhodococcus xishaensis]